VAVSVQFPVDLHAGTGETARWRRSKRRFLADEVLIDPALSRVDSVVFGGSLLRRRPAVTGGVRDTHPVSLRTFALPAPAHD
jgi:hypothetical protein